MTMTDDGWGEGIATKERKKSQIICASFRLFLWLLPLRNRRFSLAAGTVSLQAESED